jgi:hypothetical protein
MAPRVVQCTAVEAAPGLPISVCRRHCRAGHGISQVLCSALDIKVGGVIGLVMVKARRRHRRRPVGSNTSYRPLGSWVGRPVRWSGTGPGLADRGGAPRQAGRGWSGTGPPPGGPPTAVGRRTVRGSRQRSGVRHYGGAGAASRPGGDWILTARSNTGIQLGGQRPSDPRTPTLGNGRQRNALASGRRRPPPGRVGDPQTGSPSLTRRCSRRRGGRAPSGHLIAPGAVRIAGCRACAGVDT